MQSQYTFRTFIPSPCPADCYWESDLKTSVPSGCGGLQSAVVVTMDLQVEKSPTLPTERNLPAPN